MPETINKSRSAQKTRRHINAGSNKKGSRCKAGNGTNTPAPRIIANSIFGLTLKPKPGIEVQANIEITRGYSRLINDDYNQMYHDLLQCFQNALPLVGKDPSSFDPLASGMSLSQSLFYVKNAFENNILPKGFEYNVDRDDAGNYYFTVYKECDFPDFWHGFELKPIIKRLKNNKPLHDLFIQFVHSFMAKTDINGWWNGGMGFAEYSLEEEVNDWDNHYEIDESNEKEVQQNIKSYNKALATLECYEHGEAKQYATLIRNAKFRTPASILKSLSRFNSRNAIANWMKEACEFLIVPGCMNDFNYNEFKEERGEGLEFNLQISFLWDWEDDYSRIQGDCLDAEAQGCGVYPPIINVGVMPFSKKLDFNEMAERAKWPNKLSDLWKKYADLIDTIKGNKKK